MVAPSRPSEGSALQITQPPNGSFWGAPSRVTNARPAPDDAAQRCALNSTLALIDNADLNLPSLSGQPLDQNSLIITRTLLGDSNLDNIVDAGLVEPGLTTIAAPLLALAVAIVRRHAGDGPGISLRIQIEQLRIRPDICAVMGDKNGQVSDNPDASLIAAEDCVDCSRAATPQ